MNYKELRIGNHIYIDSRETAISAIDLATMCQHEKFLIDKGVVTPIYLSESILFKHGFKVEFDITPNRVYSLGDFLIRSNSSHSFNLYVGQQTVGKPFSYLHQLQNLYFAIEGKELIDNQHNNLLTTE
ncbi:MAG: hypothetical protein MJZ24_10760 [Paludibacteraceae bacterium]|nr:hypothetical protein [Paludibacteraceae bacterium]